MRKIRRKWLSVLLTLAMLVGLMVPFAGSAVADEDTVYGIYSGAYKYVSTGDDKSAGRAVVEEKEDKWGTDEIYVKLTLPEGVEYTEKATSGTVGQYVYYGTGTTTDAINSNWFVDSDSNMVQVKLPSTRDGSIDEKVEFIFNRAGLSTLKIASDVSGDIKATIEIMAVSGDDIKWVESRDITIAKVTPSEVTVTAGSPKAVEAGSEKYGAKITIAEAQPYALVESGKEVKIRLQIETGDVTFNSKQDDGTSGNYTNIKGTYINITNAQLVENDLLEVTVSCSPHALPGKVEITPVLDVPPSVEGDIVITVYKESGTSELKETTVTVATLSEVSANIKDVKDNTGTVYAGQKKVLDASFKVEATEGSEMQAKKIIVFELASGKFYDSNGSAEGIGIEVTGNASFKGLYNDDKAAWFELTDAATSIKFAKFPVKVAADAEEGDIVLKVSGTAGVSGEVVIGKIRKAFTVTADQPVLRMNAMGQAAGDIVITEAAAGAIPGGTSGAPVDLYVELPEGVSFSGTPSVKVTSGNISLGSASVEDGRLVIPVTGKSGIASTIKISNIKYNVGRLAIEGDVEVKISGEKGDNAWQDDKVLATVVNATIVSATKRNAVFTIGSNTYTVNGVEYTMDVAAYEKNGRTYLPVRYVAYALGVDPDNVYWDGATKTVTLLKGMNAVQLTIGSKALKINGATVTMDVAPELESGRTMLPFRFIAQAFGASVSYDEATKTVMMNLE
ncbi:MAG: copper amine oxidase N-terminal domain-containing protein [Thermoanaerobacteraceae bacterium]|nr:copper amine oxidase N-terminal domain-containing protein [Thermoanaerobacteraceae bacterium]